MITSGDKAVGPNEVGPNEVGPNEQVILAGASCRAVARSFVQAGYKPISFDLFADYDLAKQCQTTQVEWANWPFGILPHLNPLKGIPFVYTGGLENHGDFLRQVALSHPLWGNHPDVYESIRDPFFLEMELKSRGLFFPPILSAGSSIPEPSIWMLKPLKSSGGLGICLAKAHSIVPKGFYAQRQIVGMDISLSLLIGAKGHEVLLWAKGLECRDLLGCPEFGYVGSHWPAERLPPFLDHSLVLALGVLLSKTIGLKGWVGIDFKVDALGHCYILEVNPRYTASMELGERGHNQSFAKGHVACVKGEEWNGFSFDSDPVPQTKAILYAKKPIALSAGFSWSTVTKTLESKHNIELCDLPRPGTQMAKGAPILTIIEKGTRWPDLESRLRPLIFDLERTVEQS